MDATLLVCGVAILVVLLTVLILWANRDTVVITTKTKEAIAAHQAKSAIEITKLQLEGQKFQAQSAERVALLNCTTAQELKTMDVGVERERLATASQLMDTLQTGENLRAELQARTSETLGRLDHTYKTTALEVHSNMFSKTLESTEKLEFGRFGLERSVLEQRERESKRNSKTQKLLGELNYKTNEMMQDKETSRFQLGCSTNLAIAHERSDTALRITDKKIQGAENMFAKEIDLKKFQEVQKLERTRIKTESAERQAANNPLNAIASTLGIAALTKTPALGALGVGLGLLGNAATSDSGHSGSSRTTISGFSGTPPSRLGSGFSGLGSSGISSMPRSRLLELSCPPSGPVIEEVE